MSDNKKDGKRIAKTMVHNAQANKTLW